MELFEVIQKVEAEVLNLARRVARLERVEQGKITKINVGDAGTTLVIATGVITITKSYHYVDTEGSAATDDLVTINGGLPGDILVIRPNNTSRTIVAKDATGNLQLAGDFTMDSNLDTLTLFRGTSSWVELARSDNGL